MFRYAVIFSMVVCGGLSACVPWNQGHDNRIGRCNTLKNNFILSGATSDISKAEIQSAEAPLQERNYDRECEAQ